MTLHIDTAVLLFIGILIVGTMVLWLIDSTTGAEVRAWDQLGRAAQAARWAPAPPKPAPPPPWPTEVRVVVVTEGTSPAEVQRRIRAELER
jgi:hypothetical protein